MDSDLATLLFNTLVDGSLYALLGAAFVVLFRSTHVINFAQGALMALAGYVYIALVPHMAWSLALVATVVSMGALGAVLYLGLFRRLVGASLFSLVIATLGLATTITVAMQLIWGPQIRSVDLPFSEDPLFRLAGQPFSRLDLLTIVLAVVLLACLALVVERSSAGTRMRAVSNREVLAGLMRVNVFRMSALAWAISVGLTAAAGVAYALRSSIDPVSSQSFGLVAFAAVLIGGLDSIRGAIVGGAFLAAIQTLVVIAFDGTYAEVVAYVALLVVLMVRPQGMFGSSAVVRL